MAQTVEIRVLDKTQQALRGIKSRIDGLNKGLLGINQVAGLATAALAGIGGGNLIRSIVTTTARFEDLRTSLSSVTGSARAGADAFDFVSKFSTKTQFGIEELSETFIKLKAAGIEPTEQLLTTFTDTAAVTTDQLGSLQAITDLFSRTVSGGLGLEELNRLADRGVPVFRILEKQLGLTRLEVSEFGKTAEGANKIREALERGLNASFGGATAARVNNLSTQMSNLSIAFKNAQDAVGRQGFALALGETITQITNTITENDKLVKEIGLNLTKAFLLAVEGGKLLIANIGLITKAFGIFFGLKIALSLGSLAVAFGVTLVKGIALAAGALKALALVAVRHPLIGLVTLAIGGIEYFTGAMTKLGEKLGIIGEDGAFDKLVDGGKELAAGVLGSVNGLEEFQDGYRNINKLSQEYQDKANAIEEKTGKIAKNAQAQSEATEKTNAKLEAQKKKFDEILAGLNNELLLTQQVGDEREILKQIKDAEKTLGRELTEQEKEQLRIAKEKVLEAQKLQEAQAALPSLISETGGAFGTGSAEEIAMKEKIANLELLRKEDIKNADKYGKMINQIEKKYAIEKMRASKAQVQEQLSLIKEGRTSELNLEKLSKDQIRDLTIGAGRELLGELAKNNKAAFQVQKALAIADAIMNTARGITAALALGPIGIPLAVTIGALGAVQIGAIASQKYQGRARGGNVEGDTPYMVGERGAEMFVPNQRGTIISAESLRNMANQGGGGRPVAVHFNITANDTSGFDDLLTQRRGLIVNLINTALNERGKTGITA